MLIHWIWLSTRSGMGDRTRRLVLEHFGDAESVYFAPSDGYEAVEALSEDAVTSLLDKDLTAAGKILEDCGSKGIHILCWPDVAYPARLRNIPDPPLVLYYKGNLPDMDRLPVIGIVGTRKASAYGLTSAKRLGYQIASCGGLVVSGMAFGIDGMAMRGALTAGKSVVGVLGCGADVVYPVSNQSLYTDTQRYGCLLTEFPPGTPPVGYNFPRRNRIISGLSCGVLVVEAPEKSGALITARQAADQGRDVFVVPGNIDVHSCAGSNALLRDGAIAVSSGWDVVGEYESLYPNVVRDHRTASIQTAYPDEVLQAAEEEEKSLPKVAQKRKIPRKAPRLVGKEQKKEIDKDGAKPYSDAETPAPVLTEQEKTIVDLVQQGVYLVDDIMARANLSAGAVLAALTMLEIKGVIRRLPGKRVEMK
jgi:DNA processing protein